MLERMEQKHQTGPPEPPVVQLLQYHIHTQPPAYPTRTAQPPTWSQLSPPSNYQALPEARAATRLFSPSIPHAPSPNDSRPPGRRGVRVTARAPRVHVRVYVRAARARRGMHCYSDTGTLGVGTAKGTSTWRTRRTWFLFAGAIESRARFVSVARIRASVVGRGRV